MPVPSSTDLINPTLKAIRQAGGSAHIREIGEIVIQALGLPDVTANELHKGGPQSEFEYRLAWARTYLKHNGLITNSARGVWALTAKGNDTLTVNPDSMVQEVLQASRWSRQPSIQSSSDDVGSVNETESWQEQLIAALLEMPPDAFERLCSLMLRESGFIEVTVTGRSGDGGIDGHGIIRMGGLISFPVLFQCKRYSGSVTPSTVRDFRGAMAGRSEKGLLITTGGFTREATREATRDGAPPIDLIDGNLLADKLKELGLGIKTEMVEQVTIDSAFFEGI